MTQTTSNKHFSRRDFIKVGCLASAATGFALCGATALLPDPAPIKPESFTYGGTTMSKRVLVAYATCNGSTIKVAAEIGKTLSERGLAVDVVPIQDHPQIVHYQAVLLGSAVQHGAWLPDAFEFTKANQDALKRLPVALFCVHITNMGNDEISRRNRLAYLDPIRPLVQLRGEGFFAGKFDRRGAAMLLPGWLARLVPPMDFRNWKKIYAWTESIHPQLVQ